MLSSYEPSNDQLPSTFNNLFTSALEVDLLRALDCLDLTISYNLNLFLPRPTLLKLSKPEFNYRVYYNSLNQLNLNFYWNILHVVPYKPSFFVSNV